MTSSGTKTLKPQAALNPIPTAIPSSVSTDALTLMAGLQNHILADFPVALGLRSSTMEQTSDGDSEDHESDMT